MRSSRNIVSQFGNTPDEICALLGYWNFQVACTDSFGVVEAATKWGLAEGRAGGPLNFQSYILLANPQASAAAEVTVTFLREAGDPVVQTYTVAPTSRFTIDTHAIDELKDSSFGAVIAVTNNVPIIVERSMYWDLNGLTFTGGTNATGIKLP